MLGDELAAQGAVPPLDLAGRGGAGGLGEDVGDPVLAADLVEEHLGVVAPEAPGEDLAVVGQDLLGHPPAREGGHEVLTDRARRGPGHDPVADEEAAVVVDAGEDLGLGAVGGEYRAHHVHLPELHGPAPLPALVGAQHLAALALDDQPGAPARGRWPCGWAETRRRPWRARRRCAGAPRGGGAGAGRGPSPRSPRPSGAGRGGAGATRRPGPRGPPLRIWPASGRRSGGSR